MVPCRVNACIKRRLARKGKGGREGGEGGKGRREGGGGREGKREEEIEITN
jgi:hypothetical protein